MTQQLDELTTQRDREPAEVGMRDDEDVLQFLEAMNRRSATTNWMIAVISGLTILYFASALLIPFTIAILGYLSLRNTVVRFCRLGLNRTLAAMAVMVILLGIVITLGGVTYNPAREWLLTAPESVAKVKSKLQELRQPLETIDAATKDLGEASESSSAEQVVQVQVQQPKLLDTTAVVTRTGESVMRLAVVAVMMFFLLATGDNVVNRSLRIIPSREGRERALQLACNIQDGVGSYLGHITVINIGLGVAATIVMWLLGMPSPLLWGVLATLFNFIPYVGPLAASAVVFIAAVGEFDSFGRAALTALAFWSLTAIEGQFVTPSVLGKSLKLGPVVVLVAVAFWGFMWGIPGIFIAVPLVIAMRYTFDCFDATKPIATMLGVGDDEASLVMQLDDDKELSDVSEFRNQF